MIKYSLAFIAMFIKFSLLWSPETGFGHPNGLADSFSGIELMFVWAKLPACWQAKFTKQSALLKSHYGTDTFFVNLVLLCGDMSLNPGPGEKHPCAVYDKPVKSNQTAIQCDYCDRWHHAQGCEINNLVYDTVCDLDNAVSKVTTSSCFPKILISGDFNLPHIIWDLYDNENKYNMHNNPQYGTVLNQALLDMINHHSLSQCVKDPTRNSNILDQVHTTNPDLVKSTIIIYAKV